MGEEAKGELQKFYRARQTCKNPRLDSVNPHFNSEYASLGAIEAVIREACSQWNVGYRQRLEWITQTEGLMYSSVYDPDTGEAQKLSSFPVMANPNPQAMGSAISYARRYLSLLDFGLVGEKDDDGNAAADYARETANARPQAKQVPAKKHTAAKADTRSRYMKRIRELQGQMNAAGLGNGVDAWYVGQFNRTQPEDLTVEQLQLWGTHMAEVLEEQVTND